VDTIPENTKKKLIVGCCVGITTTLEDEQNPLGEISQHLLLASITSWNDLLVLGNRVIGKLCIE
jgi:hypothetical protein